MRNLFLIILSLSSVTYGDNWGVSSGSGEFKDIGKGFFVGGLYTVPIAKRFCITTDIKYWRMNYENSIGIRTLSCEFSDLSLSETAKWKMNFKRFIPYLGIGIGLHSLKNYVKDIKDYEGLRITDYYALNYNTAEFHTGMGIERPFQRFTIACGIRYSIILIPEKEINLFYTRGSVNAIYLSIAVFIPLKR
jgi:hypothetical protein